MKNEKTSPEEWLRGDLLARELLKRSGLDEQTLKALLLHGADDKVTFEEIAKKLKIQQPGAWKKWKRGNDLVTRSFYTLELAVYSGILDSKVAQFMADDLTDYADLARGAGDLESLRDRIERRMVQIARELQKRRSAARPRP
ncbi:MAG: hypothetical protein AB1476_06670 [Candidatus Hadarchaeota archaeon]